MSLSSVVNGSSSVSIEDPESLEARATVKLEMDLGGGSSVQFGGGLAYELLGESTKRFGNGTQIDTDFGGLNGEVAARGQFKISETVTAFGDVRGRKASPTRPAGRRKSSHRQTSNVWCLIQGAALHLGSAAARCFGVALPEQKLRGNQQRQRDRQDGRRDDIRFRRDTAADR